MKILFISDVYFLRINGVSTSVRTFVGQLQEMGHEVHLIAPDYGMATEDEHWIKRIPARAIYFDPEDRLMRYSVAQGLPVVALAELDTQSILIEGTGALIAPDNESIFADRAFSLLSDAKKRRKLGESATSYVMQRWTSRAQAEHMAHFYQHVIEQKLMN
ncbi:MAG: glycosyltransferase [Methylophilaceae bacterium]